MWVRIRFFNNPEGHYAEAWCGFRATGLIDASLRTEAFCMGYKAGSGFNASPSSIQDFSPESTECYKIPEETSALGVFLARFR